MKFQTPTSGRRDFCTTMDASELLKTAFIYSKPIPKPTFFEVIKQTRFQIRVGQLSMAIAAFGGLAGATFNAKYPFPDVGPYGVQFMVLVSIASFVSQFNS
jgi:hypothetical protein